MPKYRILSLDGGGIRGLLSVILLQRLGMHSQLEGWLDQADLLAGTSTGGLIALGLAFGMSLENIRDLYEINGPVIFKHDLLDDLVDLGKVIAAEYSNVNLWGELLAIFGETRLEDLPRRVLVTAFDMDNEATDPLRRNWKPKIFHNFPGEDSDGSQLAYKVALYTSAAPTYFPTVGGYIDGGVFASNPSMCALAQTQDPRIPETPPLSEVVLLSIGTGSSLTFIPGERHDWGYLQWAKPIINLILDGTVGIADYQCRQLLRERYFRLAPVFPPQVDIPMDSVDHIPYLVDYASSIDLDPALQWLSSQWF
jgi:patatin-like phospholipase/acyl hydrolase